MSQFFPDEGWARALLALVYLMAPAYLGNMAAPFVAHWVATR